MFGKKVFNCLYYVFYLCYVKGESNYTCNFGVFIYIDIYCE